MFTSKLANRVSAAVIFSMLSFLTQAEDPTILSGYNVKFSPRIDFSAMHTDNVLKAENEVSDTIANIMLSGNLNLSKKGQTIDSNFGFKTTEHLEVESEEIDDFFGGVSLLHNFSESFLVKVGLRYDDTTIARDAIVEGDADGRTDITTISQSIESSYKTGKQQYKLALKRDEIDTLDTETSSIAVNKDDEDRTETDLILKGNYMLNNIFQPSFTLSFSEIDYEDQIDDFGLERSSNVVEFLVGGSLKLGSGVDISGEIGHYYRDYNGISFENIEAAIGNGSISMKVNDNLSAYGAFSRSFAELNIDASPGLFIDNYSSGFSYRATDKLSFDGSFSKEITKFELLDIKLKDFIKKVGCTYEFDQHYNAGLHYVDSRRVTNSSIAQPFKENAVTLDFAVAF